MKRIHVFVTLEQAKRGPRWVVERCPLCDSPHFHGAGEDGTLLGDRVPHCAPKYNRRGSVVWNPPLDVHFVLTTDPTLYGREVNDA
jgi:hypothetical protein